MSIRTKKGQNCQPAPVGRRVAAGGMAGLVDLPAASPGSGPIADLWPDVLDLGLLPRGGWHRSLGMAVERDVHHILVPVFQPTEENAVGPAARIQAFSVRTLCEGHRSDGLQPDLLLLLQRRRYDLVFLLRRLHEPVGHG